MGTKLSVVKRVQRATRHGVKAYPGAIGHSRKDRAWWLKYHRKFNLKGKKGVSSIYTRYKEHIPASSTVAK